MAVAPLRCEHSGGRGAAGGAARRSQKKMMGAVRRMRRPVSNWGRIVGRLLVDEQLNAKVFDGRVRTLQTRRARADAIRDAFVLWRPLLRLRAQVLTSANEARLTTALLVVRAAGVVVALLRAIFEQDADARMLRAVQMLLQLLSLVAFVLYARRLADGAGSRYRSPRTRMRLLQLKVLSAALSVSAAALTIYVSVVRYSGSALAVALDVLNVLSLFYFTIVDAGRMREVDGDAQAVRHNVLALWGASTEGEK